METQKRTCSLVILAAGLGSRFGTGMKQIAPVGPSGELIMDYSIHDAMEAGFRQIIFIIRRDMEAAFQAAIGQRIEKICAKQGVLVTCAYQDSHDLPEGYRCPAGRKKPWGTGHALLACREMLHDPFVVINADDYYGKTIYRRLHDFLTALPENSGGRYCMAGFLLKNTLSEHGGVTRGICQVDERQRLLHVMETPNIIQTETGAAIERDGTLVPLESHSLVSMNMWGFTPDILERLQEAFQRFLRNHPDLSSAEFLIPVEIERMLAAGKAEVEVIPTEERWFGVTYQEDTPLVRRSFEALAASGLYGKNLYGQTELDWRTV